MKKLEVTLPGIVNCGFEKADCAETKPINNIPVQNPEPVTEKIYKIEEAMATLTMAQVLKSQHHYQEALAVLDVLESNGQNSSQITQNREEILQLISASKK